MLVFFLVHSLGPKSLYVYEPHQNLGQEMLLTDRSKAAFLVVYSNCQCSSAFCVSMTFCSFYLGWPGGHLLEKRLHLFLIVPY